MLLASVAQGVAGWIQKRTTEKTAFCFFLSTAIGDANPNHYMLYDTGMIEILHPCTYQSHQ
jgi:hypothetical protein